MDPLTLTALGSAGLGVVSAYGQHQANEMQRALSMKQMGISARQADIQRTFQAKMSGSAYQRATADMRAAGLNPMLAFMQGGASTPGGAMGGDGSGISPGNVAGAGIATAQEARRVAQEMRIGWETERHIRNQTEKTAAETQESYKRQDLLEQQTTSAKWQAELARLSVPEQKALAQLFERYGEAGKGGQLLMPLLLQLMRSAR